MQHQGAGNVILFERLSDNTLGPGKVICPDSYILTLNADKGTHTNRCGPVNQVDASWINSLGGTVEFSFTDVKDANYAIGVFGTVIAADVSPSSITNEAIPGPIIPGDTWGLGGDEPHQNITSLVLEDADSVPNALVLDTDYTLNAVTGLITFLTAQSGGSADYSHQDKAAVSLLTAGQKEYLARFENINRRSNLDPGAFFLWRIAPAPTSNLDMMPDNALQTISISADILADPNRSYTDTEWGQFGKRIL